MALLSLSNPPTTADAPNTTDTLLSKSGEDTLPQFHMWGSAKSIIYTKVAHVEVRRLCRFDVPLVPNLASMLDDEALTESPDLTITKCEARPRALFFFFFLSINI